MALLIFTMDYNTVYYIYNNSTAVYHISPMGCYTVVNQNTSGRLSEH